MPPCMAEPVPSVEPSSFVAGDTVAWTKSLSDYLPSDWTLSYSFRAEDGGALLNVTGAASGNDHALTISAASTSTLRPGTWLWHSYVTAGAVRYTVGSGSLSITPNFQNINYTTDLRSSAKKAYDNALAAWENVRLGQTVTLNGRTYTQHNLDSLTRYVDRCRLDYASELRAQEMAKTGIDTRRIGVRFSRV